VKKIAWAIDAFEETGEIQSRCIDAITQLVSTRPGVSIYPVYVLSPEHLNLPIEFNNPLQQHYSEVAIKAIHARLKDLKLKNVKEPKVVVQQSATIKGSATKLINFCKANKMELIVVGTHGRTGIQRAFLGSFAETLLNLSKIPVLVVGAHATSSSMKHLLFPSDLQNRSLKVFNRMLKTAKELGAKVTLLHCIPRPIEAVFQSGVYLFSGGWVPANLYLEKGEEKQRKIAKKWLDTAKKAGVTTDLVLDTTSVSIVESILRHAQSLNADLIAMPAQSGAVASTLIGSYTRQIVRNALCPVWVLKAEK
jgi:nucleotide-binding universal stress UspA family protein